VVIDVITGGWLEGDDVLQAWRAPYSPSELLVAEATLMKYGMCRLQTGGALE
jgi:hypothetical protein